ncbi:MAG: YggU family protein [Nitrospinaceae bacterium]|nr:YggU family protein [Nitrospinaceae bacterium]NIR55720.1 YggU family protein [Nitrospinaceae bacterium]NIS86160.1 YggU family protein [Nitrospinaceae bacterium]NIT80464.1 YggU family protein [Nitrospinaceae bacterium]NIU45208.1 YggU family protein [Nitrospinaceae bacterium]
MSILVKPCKDGIQFSATIQPRSAKNAIMGVHNQTLKIKLTSPPVDGAANESCIRFLAKTFGLSPSRVSIVKGETRRNKTIRFEGMDETEFMNLLNSLTGGPG